MTIGSAGGSSRPQAAPKPDTAGLEKDIQSIRQKLQSINDDIKRYRADRAKGGKEIDEKIRKLQQVYQRFSADLGTKETQLSQMRQPKNQAVQSPDQAPKNNNAKLTAEQEQLKKAQARWADKGRIIDLYA